NPELKMANKEIYTRHRPASPRERGQARAFIRSMGSTSSTESTNTAEAVHVMVADPLVWMQRHTCTKDSHWREHGPDSPYRPFPETLYFHPLLQSLKDEPVIFIEKSRDMMLSWLTVAFFTHAAMTTQGIQILFQSQKDEKACELVEYARILYEHSDEAIRS